MSEKPRTSLSDRPMIVKTNGLREVLIVERSLREGSRETEL